MSLIKNILGIYRRAYSGLPRNAWILFGVNLVNSAGSMVLFFLSLYFTQKLGFSVVEAGRALSLYGVGSLAGAYIGGWLSDRVGSTSVQKLSLVSSGALLIVLGQIRTPAVLLPAILIFGVAAGSLYPANGTSMARVCPPNLLVKGFALNRLANNLGVTIGPAIGGLLALRDYRLLFWVDGLTCLAAAVLFILIWPKAEIGLRAAEKKTASGGGGRSPWRDGPFLGLMLITILFSVVFVQLFSTFPLYMRSVYGLAEDAIGRLLAVNTIMIVLLEMALMELIRKYPLTRMINISFLLLGLGFGLIPLGRGFAYAAVTVAIWTFGEMLSMPLFTSLISGRADPESRGRYLGLFSFAFSLALIIGPTIGTAIYGRWGGSALWYGCGAAGLLLAAAFSLLKPSLDKAPAG